MPFNLSLGINPKNKGNKLTYPKKGSNSYSLNNDLYNPDFLSKNNV